MPVTSPAAPPPVEPPALRVGSHGLRVRPNTSLKVFPPAANSGQFVFPRITAPASRDRKSTRLNSSHSQISYAVFCLKKKNPQHSSITGSSCTLSIPRGSRAHPRPHRSSSRHRRTIADHARAPHHLTLHSHPVSVWYH